MLEKVALFSGLPPEEIESFERLSVKKSYKKHTIVIDKGDETSSLYVILSGSIKVFLADEDGKEIVLSHMAPGDYFGELALIGETQRSASVMTLEDSKFLIISKSALRTCLSKNPGYGIQHHKRLDKSHKLSDPEGKRPGPEGCLRTGLSACCSKEQPMKPARGQPAR